MARANDGGEPGIGQIAGSALAFLRQTGQPRDAPKDRRRSIWHPHTVRKPAGACPWHHPAIGYRYRAAVEKSKVAKLKVEMPGVSTVTIRAAAVSKKARKCWLDLMAMTL